MTDLTQKADFAKRLRKAIGYKGYNQSSLARAMKIRPQSVQQWCDPKSKFYPSGANLPTVSHLLGVSVDWLFGRTEEGGPGGSTNGYTIKADSGNEILDPNAAMLKRTSPPPSLPGAKGRSDEADDYLDKPAFSRAGPPKGIGVEKEEEEPRKVAATPRSKKWRDAAIKAREEMDAHRENFPLFIDAYKNGIFNVIFSRDEDLAANFYKRRRSDFKRSAIDLVYCSERIAFFPYFTPLYDSGAKRRTVFAMREIDRLIRHFWETLVYIKSFGDHLRHPTPVVGICPIDQNGEGGNMPPHPQYRYVIRQAAELGIDAVMFSSPEEAGEYILRYEDPEDAPDAYLDFANQFDPSD